MTVKDLLVLKSLYNGELTRNQLMEIYKQDTQTLMPRLMHTGLAEKERKGKVVIFKITEEGKRQFTSVMERLLL